MILDDVVSPSIISAFDIGCKILVTTHDVGIMNGASDNADYIRVSTTEIFENNSKWSLLSCWKFVLFTMVPYCLICKIFLDYYYLINSLYFPFVQYGYIA